VVLRRLLLLVVLLLVLLAVANAIAPRETTQSPSPAPGPVTTPSPPVAQPVPPAGGDTVDLELSVARAGARNVVRARVGELVRLVVFAREPGSVELSGYDLTEPVDAASPAEFEFFADRAGIFTVRLVESGALVGRLRVKPTA
jgi:hypothetical protein